MSKETLFGVDPTQRHQGCDYPLYLLDELKAAPGVHYEKHCEGTHALDGLHMLWTVEGDGKCKVVQVVFMEFEQSGMNGENETVNHLMSASGPTDFENYRECRHIRTGNDFDGYLYYLNVRHMEKALDLLRRWFDV
jgi:hypothetical protein